MWSKKRPLFSIFSKSTCLSINNHFVTFKVTSLKNNTLMLAFFPILETLLKRAFWYRQQLLFRFFFYLLNRSKTLSFHRCLQFWEEGAKSGEYGGWGIISVLLVAKDSRTSIDVWAGALSWCKIHDWFFHNSVHFWRNASRNRRITSRLYSLSTLRPCGKNSWCTMPLQVKKTVN